MTTNNNNNNNPNPSPFPFIFGATLNNTNPPPPAAPITTPSPFNFLFGGGGSATTSITTSSTTSTSSVGSGGRGRTTSSRNSNRSRTRGRGGTTTSRNRAAAVGTGAARLGELLGIGGTLSAAARSPNHPAGVGTPADDIIDEEEEDDDDNEDEDQVVSTKRFESKHSRNVVRLISLLAGANYIIPAEHNYFKVTVHTVWIDRPDVCVVVWGVCVCCVVFCAYGVLCFVYVVVCVVCMCYRWVLCMGYTRTVHKVWLYVMCVNMCVVKDMWMVNMICVYMVNFFIKLNLPLTFIQSVQADIACSKPCVQKDPHRVHCALHSWPKTGRLQVHARIFILESPKKIHFCTIEYHSAPRTVYGKNHVYILYQYVTYMVNLCQLCIHKLDTGRYCGCS